jgi:ferrochelatase
MTDNGKTGVVLLNLGGPDSLDAVKPFLFNLFSDPDIINFPLSFLFRKRLAKLISDKRSEKVKLQYSQIGGNSPLLDLTMKQAAALEKLLKTKINAKVYLAMRYWHPFTEEALSEMEKDGVERIIQLPLYPHYSSSTTGSSVNEWNRIVESHPAIKSIETKLVEHYYDFPPYIDAIVENINITLEKFPENVRNNVNILFSAHGTPMKLVRQGDPYSKHIAQTVKLVMERGKYQQKHYLCFQSKVGPQKWLEPKTIDVIEKLADEGVKNLLIIPIAFVSDHLETLYEIGIEFRHLAKEKGVEQFEVMPALNDSPKFVEALSELVIICLD